MRGRLIGLVATVLIGLSACGSPSASPQSSALTGSLTVFAASSLTAAFTTIGSSFEKSHPGTAVHFSFGGSAILVAQIQQGSLGDIFASADQPNMQKLAAAHLLSGSASTFARNRLQIVVTAGNPKRITSLADLGRPGLLVVLCAPVVPCGRYAAQSLRKAKVSVRPASEEADVKAVLSKVTLGEADAGIVYVTDVKAAGAAVQGVEIPDSANIIADYPIAVLSDSHQRPLARAFVAYVLGAGEQALARYGFARP